MSSSAVSAPNLPPDENRAVSCLAILWVFMALATITLGLRMYVRTTIKALGKDDFLMVASWALYLVTISFWTVMIDQGDAGRHVYYLTTRQIVISTKYNFLSQPVAIMASAFGKCSVGFLVLRIVGPATFWRKWFLHINMGLYTLISIFAASFTVGQCNPSRALWEPAGTFPHAKCWDKSISQGFAYTQASYGAFLDFALALMPMSIFWHLQLKIVQKVALCFFMGLGAFTGVATIFKALQIKNLGTTIDITWNSYGLVLWSGSEQCLIIICGSIPTLKPLYDRIVHHKGATIKSHIALSKQFNSLDETGLINQSGNISKVTARNSARRADDKELGGGKNIVIRSTYDIELEDIDRDI